jgi:hypothetical protein
MANPRRRRFLKADESFFDTPHGTSRGILSSTITAIWRWSYTISLSVPLLPATFGPARPYVYETLGVSRQARWKDAQLGYRKGRFSGSADVLRCDQIPHQPHTSPVAKEESECTGEHPRIPDPFWIFNLSGRGSSPCLKAGAFAATEEVKRPSGADDSYRSESVGYT